MFLAFVASFAFASDHLQLAEDLVDTVLPGNNVYASGVPVVTWEGNGSTASVSANCSGLVNTIMSAAYPTLSMKSWMGCSRPIAQAWYDNIQAENHFIEITNIADIAPGDILVYSYQCANTTCGNSGSTCSTSGHVMIASSHATARVATAPLVAGTTQYEIAVIDSANSPHGSLDTRYLSASNQDDTGVGEGFLRLYANSSGGIEGYSWSTARGSTYYGSSTRPMVVGRYQP